MISVFVSLTTLLAMQLLARKQVAGFYVGVVSQILWVWLIVATKQWGLLPLTVAMLVTYGQGIRNWSKEAGRSA